MHKNSKINIDLVKKSNIFQESLTERVKVGVSQYKAITKLKKNIFNFVILKIEKFNNVKYNKKYWKIILYPWLDGLVTLLFLQWKLISKKKKFNKIYEYPENTFIENSFEKILYYNNFHFNQWIWSKIIYFRRRVIKKEKIIFFKKKNNVQNKNFLFNFLNFFRFFLPSNKIVLKGVQIGFINKLLLNIKLRQFPIVYKEDLSIDNKINMKLRKKIFYYNFKKKNLESFIKKNLIYLIPKNYLENFNDIIKSINKSYWPKKTKLIITGNEYWFNDFFKIWAAEQKFKNKSKYIIMQHGGKMGTEKIISNLDTQIDICDKFISWGWKAKNNKIIPFYSLLASKPLKINYLKKKKIIFFQKVYPNYFAHIDGSPFTLKEKILSLNISNKFFNFLNKKIKKNFILRFQEQLAKDSFYFYKYLNKNIKRENWNKKFVNLIKESKLCVHDLDSTTFLETLSYNVPTLVILNKNYINNLSLRAKKYYKILEKNNIIFTDIKLASMFVNNNYYQIDKWWDKKATQKARISFCENFVNLTSKPVDSMYRLIKKL